MPQPPVGLSAHLTTPACLLAFSSSLPFPKNCQLFLSNPHSPATWASSYLFHRRRNRGSRRSDRLPELTSTRQMWQICIQFFLIPTCMLFAAGSQSPPCLERPLNSEPPSGEWAHLAEGGGPRLIIETAPWWSPHLWASTDVTAEDERD